MALRPAGNRDCGLKACSLPNHTPERRRSRLPFGGYLPFLEECGIIQIAPLAWISSGVDSAPELTGRVRGVFIMIIVEEKKLNNSEKLKLIVSKLDRLASLVNMLTTTVGVLQFSESYLNEGTMEDRRFVETKIREIQTLTYELDQINLEFESNDLLSPAEKQQRLNKAIVDADVIRSGMLDLWGMRNSGSTPRDNETIVSIVKLLFTRVNKVLKLLKKYVDDFNAASHVKLRFSIKWTPLPK